jgi:NAD(P)-dependent dehydrogenase (short-subunit alcohol dehydrogenase family)
VRLRGMTAVVTGAGTGIGRAIATKFAREGADLVLGGRRAEPLAETASAIEKAGGRAVAVAADVTADRDVRRLADAATDAFGKIDILVNNAGAVVSRTTVLDCSEDDWRSTVDANLHSAFLCSKHMLPELIRNHGNILHVASVFSLVGAANSAAYTASKGALVSLTRAMAIDFGAAGVRVNALCPAYVETDINREMLDGLRAAGNFGAILARLPMGHLGEPDDVAFAALYLASPEARWITGVALPVDGGMSAGRT